MNDKVELVQKIAKVLADSIGHGMTEKCETHAARVLDAIEQLAGGGEAVAWAYGVPDSAITGSRGPLMQVMLEIPKDAQYPELLVPLYPIPPATVPQSEHDALKEELRLAKYDLEKERDVFALVKQSAERRLARVRELEAHNATLVKIHNGDPVPVAEFIAALSDVERIQGAAQPYDGVKS